MMKSSSQLSKLQLETGNLFIFIFIFIFTSACYIEWLILLIKLLYCYCLTAILSLYSLFHVVVENDDISTHIIRHLNARKGGRVTFIPLNRVKAPHITYPQSSDVVPLLNKLKFSRDHAPAFAQVRFAESLP